jgi:type VI secretion system protein ImpL
MHQNLATPMHASNLKKLMGMLLTAVVCMASLPSRAERNLEAEIANSSADFALNNKAPSDACAEIGDDSPHGQALCAQQFAIKQLQMISLLSEESRLYAPPRNALETDDYLFVLDTTAVKRDYLNQQLGRVSVLAGYARPFIRYLQTSKAGVKSADETYAQVFWKNTITALENHWKFKAQHGPVALLEQLYLNRIHGLTLSRCPHRFDTNVNEPEFGNDLFSKYRYSLTTTAQARCRERAYAMALASYLSIATRFNRELKDHYPFGELNKSSFANIDATREFLNDYLAQRQELIKQSQFFPEAQRDDVLRYFNELDATNRYWGAAFGVKAAPKGLPVQVQFRALPSYSEHGDQLVHWEISTGDQVITHANSGQQTLRWVAGHSIGVRFVLASGSPWSVVPDPTQPDFIADGKSAAFVITTPWALIDLIQQQRPNDLPASLPGLPPRYWLEFKIPLIDSNQRQTTAKVYMALMLDMPIPIVKNISAPT